jgi:hypothetical protein
MAVVRAPVVLAVAVTLAAGRMAVVRAAVVVAVALTDAAG